MVYTKCHPIWCALFISTLISGCVSDRANLIEQNYSVAQIRNALMSTIGEIRRQERSGRVFDTGYFGSDRKLLTFGDKPATRYFSRVFVVGDRRPYDLEVEVIVEKMEFGTYVETGTDKKMARDFASELAEKLKIEKSGKSVVDDFKAF